MNTDDTSGNDSTDYKDPETLRRLYWDEGLSMREIGERFGVTNGAIQHWMDKHEIDRRGISESITSQIAGFETSYNGYERWRSEIDGAAVRVHRLLAVSEYGLDAVKDNHIHHENGIRWDNRPSNIKPLSPSEHIDEHHKGQKSANSKLTDRQVVEIKRLLDSTDMTHDSIAKSYGVSQSLISMIANGKRRSG